MANNNMTATLKYALTSDKKMLILAKLVQGKSVEEALRLLEFTEKRPARILYKVISSAGANAVNNEKLNKKSLYVKTIHVGRGPKLKRVRFVSRSKISHYVKYRAFVKVILDSK